MRRLTLPLLLLSSLTFLVGLGRGAITDADEAFYAEAAREMVESGDFVTPFYNYEPRFQKPILYYWLTAGTFELLGGPSEAGARLWAALSGVGLVLITAACARRWFDDGAALLSAAMVATSFGYYSIGRVALPDLPLTFFITLAIWAAWIALLEDEGHPTRWVVLSAVGLALGFLTKGPVGIIVPGLVVGTVALIERRRVRLRPRDVVIGAILFALIALPWYGVMWSRHGAAYLEGFFLGDNLERFATERFNEARAWWFYGPVVMGGLLPWTPLAIVWLPPTWRFLTRRRQLGPLELRLIVWAALPLVFYSLSVGKQPRYILPVLPPLAMLLASSVLERTRAWPGLRSEGARRSFTITAGGLIAGALLVALAGLLWRASPLLINVAPQLTQAAAGAIGLAGLGVIVVAASPAWRRIPVALALAAAITFPALQFGALSGTGDGTVEQVARVVRAAHTGHEQVGTHDVFVRNLVYYGQMPTVDLSTPEQLAAFLAEDSRVLVVSPAAAIEQLEQAQGRRFRRLAEIPYFNEAGIRLRTLLWPDPSRDISRVLVVSNR